MINSGVSVPSIVADLDGMQIDSIGAGSDRSAMVNSYGELYSWGSAKNGSMLTAAGKTYPDNLTLPTVFEDAELQFNSVAVGRDHMAVVTKDGRVFTMGSGDHGKLGHNIVQTDEEKKAARLEIKLRGYSPGIAGQKAALGFAKGELEGKVC